MKQNIQKLNSKPKREPLSRVWFMSRGCKQVPFDLTCGKVLWAHPDGYFLNAYGQKVKHNYNPRSSTPRHHGVNYPNIRHHGGKRCHILMCVTFHGPRPLGYECDHINGNKLDYSASNLQWVTPAENRRRARYIRLLRKYGFDPRIFSTPLLHEFFAMPYDDFKTLMEHQNYD